MRQMRDLSVVIPSYNARGLLQRTLRTLAVAAPEAEVIVVDGRSEDGSPEMVAAEFPTVRVLRHENHGFAHAINRGLEHARGHYILLLNSDLFVSRAAVTAMLRRLCDPEVGAAAPVLLNEDGSRQHLFGPWYWPNLAPVRRVSRVPLLAAACLMTRRDVLKEVGGLDENFFLYNEEYDWCVRVLRAGLHLELLPERVVHVGGGSTPPSPALTLEAQRGFLYLAQKHAPPVVVEGLRRAMRLEGWLGARIDPRPEHRAMWEQLEALTERRAYLDSPFPLSGRGTHPAEPRRLWVQADPRPRPRPVAVEDSRASRPGRSSTVRPTGRAPRTKVAGSP